jgi:hypothetical protein
MIAGMCVRVRLRRDDQPRRDTDVTACARSRGIRVGRDASRRCAVEIDSVAFVPLARGSEGTSADERFVAAGAPWASRCATERLSLVFEEVDVTKRSTSLLALATLAAAGVLALSVAPGCSSSSSDPGTLPVNYPPAVPEKRPATKATGTDKWFAVNGLKLGLTPKTSTTKNTNAWKDYGFDIDSRNTSADDSRNGTNTCTRVTGAPSGMLADGNGGRDNNFGGHIMQTISQLQAGAEDSVNKSITDGSFTLLLHLTNYTTGDNDSVPGELFIANDYGDKTGTGTKKTPTFTTADTEWPVVPESMTTGATTIPGNAKLKFAKGFVSNGYWVSGDFGGTDVLNLDISISGATISLPIAAGVVSFKVADGSDGTIAGLMGVQMLQDSLGPVARKFGICPSSPTYQQVVQTLTQSADLTNNAPAGDKFNTPGKPCDAISIALGFTVKETAAPTLIHDKAGAPGPDQCDTDAGTDAATGG